MNPLKALQTALLVIGVIIWMAAALETLNV